jgi:hypothetical protein
MLMVNWWCSKLIDIKKEHSNMEILRMARMPIWRYLRDSISITTLSTT